MTDIAAHPVIAPMSLAGIDQVGRLEEMSLAYLPQLDLPVDDCLHAGIYQRTIMVPAGAVVTGALIKIPTLLIVNGDCLVYVEGGPIELHGHHVLRASGGRKQAVIALTDTHFTMLFATKAQSVEEAEREFTDEYERLRNPGKEG